MKTAHQRLARRAVVWLVLLCLLVPVRVFAGPAQGAGTRGVGGRARRVLLVSLDGLDVRYLRDADRYGLKIPTLRRLMAEGAWAGVVAVYPSVTYPNHTTMVTGAPPSLHRIFGNEVFTPETPRANIGHWFARDIRADTLWDAARRAGLSAGLVSWPVGGGAGDWNVPEIWKPGASAAGNLAETAANAVPRGLVAEIAARDRELFARGNKDEGDDMRTRAAAYIIREKRPALMLVHLFDFDHFQHDYGIFTPEVFAMLEKQDAYLARLLDAAERAGTLKETAVFITSDHGFRSVRRQVHPGVILAGAKLLKLGAGDGQKGNDLKVTDWRAMPNVTGGSCAIILRDPRDGEAVSRALLAFAEFERRAGEELYRVVGAREVRRLGGDVRAAFVLEGVGDVSFGKHYTGAPVTAADDLGQHGFLPAPADYRASFIASGAGVKRRGDLGTIRMLDVGPTAARALGLVLRDSRGHALRL